MRVFEHDNAPRLLFGVVLSGFLAFLLSGPAIGQDKLKERSEIPDKYKWDLSAIYKSDADWEADVKTLEGMIPALKSFQGKISQSPDDLLRYFKTFEDVSKKLDNAATYASISYDQDTRDQKYTGFKDRISNLATKFGEALSWFTPELVSIPAATFEKWYKDKPELAVYKHYIDNQLRTRKHTLSPAEERILALSGDMAGTPSGASTSLRNSDMTFPSIKDENGKDIPISESRMARILESPDKQVRRDATIAFLDTYGKYKNTLAALMSGNIAKDVFYSRSRGYNSALEASLDNEDIDTTVFLNLIETVKKGSASLRRYCDLRRRALGLDSIHLYDMFVPLIPATHTEYSYDEAVKTIEAALAPLGKEYHDQMMAGFNSRWVDAYENKGKRSGGYSTATYLSHPYIFYNYDNTFRDMSGVAHEMGHAMHFWHAMKHQPYVYADNPIFTAEVASTFNEALLMDHMLKKEKDPKKRLYLVNQYIDNIRGTLITQTMWADFELRIHRAGEAGEPLTAETLGKMYRETLLDYYGNSIAYDPQYDYTWSRIPHFYRNYYVYKYATSYAASQALSQKVLKGEKGARDRYLHFLSGGSSKYPLDLLKDAGVDLTTPQPVEATMKKFAELVNEMEKLLKETGRLSANSTFTPGQSEMHSKTPDQGQSTEKKTPMSTKDEGQPIPVDLVQHQFRVSVRNNADIGIEISWARKLDSMQVSTGEAMMVGESFRQVYKTVRAKPGSSLLRLEIKAINSSAEDAKVSMHDVILRSTGGKEFEPVDWFQDLGFIAVQGVSLDMKKGPSNFCVTFEVPTVLISAGRK